MAKETKGELILSPTEKVKIKKALQHVYDYKVEFIKKHGKMLSIPEKKAIMKNANEYFDLSEKF